MKNLVKKCIAIALTCVMMVMLVAPMFTVAALADTSGDADVRASKGEINGISVELLRAEIERQYALEGGEWWEVLWETLEHFRNTGLLTAYQITQINSSSGVLTWLTLPAPVTIVVGPYTRWSIAAQNHTQWMAILSQVYDPGDFDDFYEGPLTSIREADEDYFDIMQSIRHMRTLRGAYRASERDFSERRGEHSLPIVITQPGTYLLTLNEGARSTQFVLEITGDTPVQQTQPQADTITVTIDNTPVNFADQAPTIINGRTLVPARGVFEALGFDPSWNEQAQQVTLSRDRDIILISIGSATFTTNGVSHTLDVPAQIINGRTMLPIRAVLESLGYDLNWEDSARTVVISTH